MTSTIWAQALPVTPPTGETPANEVTPTPPATTATAAGERHRASVEYANGQLSVEASNSSLNQILREIGRQTGMKITGGVTDERVFGSYGPAAPGVILAGLLDGTGSNMLLVQTEEKVPAELILTPRQGGPTPPNPSASVAEDDAPVRPPLAQQLPAPPAVPVQTTQPADQTPSASGFVSAPTVSPATEPGTTPGPTTQITGQSDPQSPNGVKTPQQIYEQLQLLQQQQQQQAKPN